MFCEASHAHSRTYDVDRSTSHRLCELVAANSYALWELTWTFGCYYLWINCDLWSGSKGFVDNMASLGVETFSVHLNASVDAGIGQLM